MAPSAARATGALAALVGKDGLLVGIDRDPAAIHAAKERLRGLPVRLVQANFCDLPEVLEQLGIDKIDGVVLDLGLSSDQLADRTRGLAFRPMDRSTCDMIPWPASRRIEC